MGRSTAYSIAVARGAMATAGGYPDPDSMTWVPFATEHSYEETFGKGVDPTADVVLTGATPGVFSAPVVPNPINTTGATLFGAPAGEEIRRFIVDSLSMRTPVYNPDGTIYAAHLDMPFFQILKSSMGLVIPGAPTNTTTALGPNAYQFKPTVADIADYELGCIVSVNRDGKTEYARVTKIDTTGGAELITVHPHWPGGALPNNTVVRLHATFYPRTGTVSTADEVHFRYDTGDENNPQRRYIFRAVMSELTLEPVEDSQGSGGGPIYATIVVRPGSKTAIEDDANAATVTYTPPGTAVATQLQSCRRIGDALVSTYSAPGHGAASNWALKSWAVNIKFALGSDGGCGGVLYPENGVTQAGETFNLNFTMAGNTAFDRAMVKGHVRTFQVGTGPADMGFCAQLNAGHLAETEKRGEENESGQQGFGTQTISGTLRQDAWTLDTGTGDAKNKAWCIGFPIPTP